MVAVAKWKIFVSSSNRDSLIIFASTEICLCACLFSGFVFLIPKLEDAPFPSVINLCYWIAGRSRWPRGLWRSTAAARLLRLRVRMPPRAWMSVSLSVVCCAGRGLCEGADPSSTGVLPSVCVSVSVIRCNNNPLHLQWVGRSRQSKKEELVSSAEQYTSVDTVPCSSLETAMWLPLLELCLSEERTEYIGRWLCVFIPCFRARDNWISKWIEIYER